jgi:bifunctional UDP-N-acetylglucosamine pyrophosphorylase/glucosamine-1-phosphate N-acetyltransferase
MQLKQNGSMVGIILAAGRGKRFGAEGENKTAALYEGKPMVAYGVELLAGAGGVVSVVVGVGEESVRKALAGYQVRFVRQTEPKGTGDAVRAAVDDLKKRRQKPEIVLVGYGDHMMFYDRQMLGQLTDLHRRSKAAVTLVCTEYDQPDELCWGRIVRKADGGVERIVEHKDANPKERQIRELNAGFYAFDGNFLRENIGKLMPSAVTGEYYLTDLIKAARDADLPVAGLVVPFEKVGLGINTRQELSASQKLFEKYKNSRGVIK